jgi:hypothetical protein
MSLWTALIFNPTAHRFWTTALVLQAFIPIPRLLLALSSEAFCPLKKSNNPGGLRRETQSIDIPPLPPCNVRDQNGHIIVQVTSHQLQLQSPGCAPMVVFVGFLVDTVTMEQVLLWVLQFSPVKSQDTIVIHSFLLYHRRGGGVGPCTHYWVQFQMTMLHQPQEHTVGHQIFFFTGHNRTVIICLIHVQNSRRKKLNLSVLKGCLAQLMQDSTITYSVCILKIVHKMKLLNQNCVYEEIQSRIKS